MKKFLSLLLALSMVLALVACGGNNGNNANNGNNQNGNQQNEQQNEDNNEQTPPSTETHPNRVIYASNSGVSGDIGYSAYWTNNADDKLIRDLINDYGTVSFDRGGQMVQNQSVCESIESVMNEDGTKTYTVKIKQGLVYNNGEPITAADFVAGPLVFASPVAKSIGAKYTPGSVVGDIAYQNGEVNYLSGLRMLDEYTYAITIPSDKVPYFFDMSYASLSPLYLPMYSSAELTVKDDGQGVYIDGGELVGSEIDATRWMYDSPVSAGPYTLKSLDTASYEAVLELNPNYAGNFEGQKPTIQQIVLAKSDTSTQFDALKSGAIDVLSGLTDGKDINQAVDLAEQGGYTTHSFERNGYGKIQFQCDFGPTQFQAVRQAVAYLLDRNEFANTFCQGWGAVVHGPYGLAMWMYKDSEELFASELNEYQYNPAKAVELLEADGWTLNEDGTPYSGSGTRYKEVTPEEAGDYELNVTLDDGRILMPLHIMWSSSEGNSVSELLSVMLSNGTQVADAGMVIEQVIMTFDELLLYMYRDSTQGDRYGVPTYGMYNLATDYTPIYDRSYNFTSDPELVAKNYNDVYLFDDELDKLTMDMVYSVEATDSEGYLDLWQKYVIRWNSLLPEIPLYSNVYMTVTPDWLLNYEESSLSKFAVAILYASVENAE